MVERSSCPASSLSDLQRELRDLSRELNVRGRLRGWSSALTSLPRRNVQHFEWLLLALDVEANTIKVTGFENRQRAAEELAVIERSRSSNLDVVLVWVRSIHELKSAYPNYYADTRKFMDALEFALKM